MLALAHKHIQALQTRHQQLPLLETEGLQSGLVKAMTVYMLKQCFSTAGTRPGTGPWQQLYRAVRGSPGICHFSFLRNFYE